MFFVNKLIAHAHSGGPRYVDVSIYGDGFFQASCRKCYSEVEVYLDEGHINICEHEMELLLGIDLLMSDNKNFIPDLKARRMEAFLAKQKIAYGKINDEDPQKARCYPAEWLLQDLNGLGFKYIKSQTNRYAYRERSIEMDTYCLY